MNIWNNHCGWFFAHPTTGTHIGPFDDAELARIAWEGEQLLSYLN